MIERIRKVAIFVTRSAFVLTMLLLPTAAVFGQAVVTDWSNVQGLTPGTLVVVEKKSGQAVKGSVKSTQSDSIVVLGKKGEETIPKVSITSIFLGRAKSKRRAGFAAVGVFLATALALTPIDTKISPDWPTVIPVLGGLATGAVTYKGLMKGLTKGPLVYRA